MEWLNNFPVDCSVVCFFFLSFNIYWNALWYSALTDHILYSKVFFKLNEGVVHFGDNYMCLLYRLRILYLKFQNPKVFWDQGCGFWAVLGMGLGGNTVHNLTTLGRYSRNSYNLVSHTYDLAVPSLPISESYVIVTVKVS